MELGVGVGVDGGWGGGIGIGIGIGVGTVVDRRELGMSWWVTDLGYVSKQPLISQHGRSQSVSPLLISPPVHRLTLPFRGFATRLRK